MKRLCTLLLALCLAVGFVTAQTFIKVKPPKPKTPTTTIKAPKTVTKSKPQAKKTITAEDVIKAKGEANKKAGAKFIDQFRNDPSYHFTSSGLCYKVLSEGEGNNFTANDSVIMKYELLHINDETLEESRDEVVFVPSRMIPGLCEGILLMKPGAQYFFIIPGYLAFGERFDKYIGPHETLQAMIETVGVKKD